MTYNVVGDFMICTFFGHKNTSYIIENELHKTIIDLIENKKVTTFYVGHQGNFDFLVRKNLEELCQFYPQIKYYIVLAYMPKSNDFLNEEYRKRTIYPDGLEKVPPKFAIIKRNQWMIDKSDYVVTHIHHNFSNASKLKDLAERKGKIVINIT